MPSPGGDKSRLHRVQGRREGGEGNLGENIEWYQSKDALRTSILRMFQDYPVLCPDQTGYEKMHCIGFLLEFRRRSIQQGNQCLKPSHEDWKRMPNFYLILWIESVREDWNPMQLRHDRRSTLCMLNVWIRIQPLNKLKCFKSLCDHLTRLP